jgi:hypothetical protein
MDGPDRVKKPLRRSRLKSHEEANGICTLGSAEWSVQSV